MKDEFFGKISYGNMFTNLIDKYKDSCLVDLVRLIVCDSGASTNWVFCYRSSVVVIALGPKQPIKEGLISSHVMEYNNRSCVHCMYHI